MCAIEERLRPMRSRSHWSKQSRMQNEKLKKRLTELTKGSTRYGREMSLAWSIPLARMGWILFILLVAETSLWAQNVTLSAGLNMIVGRHPEAMTLADFNEDGFLDVATANRNSDDVTVLLGNGNGTFQAPISLGAGKSPMGIAAGDMDRDGHVDLVVAETQADRLVILQGRGNGLFGPLYRYPTGKGPTKVALADLDQDRDLDVVTVNSGWRGHYPPFSLAILLNQGNGQLSEARFYEQGARHGMFPTDVSVKDLNGDSLPDLTVTWSQPGWRTPNGLVTVLVNKGQGEFEPALEMRAGLTLSAVAQADFNGDKRVDLVVTSAHTDEVRVLLANQFGQYAKGQSLKTGFTPVAVAIGHLNADDASDIVVANHASSSVSVFLGMGDGTFRPAGHFAVGQMPTGLGVRDLDGDEIADIVTVNSVSNDLTILLSGRKGIPSITLSTEQLVFARQEKDAGTKTVIVSNIGLGPLRILDVELGGQAPAAFVVDDDNCRGVTLETGKWCKVHVDFTAKTPGTHHAQLIIWDNAPGSPHFIVLRGRIEG
ncbi:MAG: VCBS repeat-containing protein [Nitrospirae bacterium]|nr:MAG: VCBS repeat-containing protein [Nitrospirota bacterium]